MKKLEVILSQAIDADFMRACLVMKVGQHYTKSIGVQGCGNTCPKMGDEIWPQLNNHYMMCIPDEELKIIKKIITNLRTKYPDEGITCFVTETEEL
ncbi:MAG: PG0541 family transporter-associated protein [Sphaerochaetaceae bacterium]